MSAFIAAAHLAPTGYQIMVGRAWLRTGPTDDEIRAVLMHECAHILRGDCIRLLPDREHNVAADALINRTLDQDVIAGLGGVLERHFRTADGPVDRLPDLAEAVADQLRTGRLVWAPPHAPKRPEAKDAPVPTPAGLIALLPDPLQAWIRRAGVQVLVVDVPGGSPGVWDAAPGRDPSLTPEAAEELHALAAGCAPGVRVRRRPPKPLARPAAPIARLVETLCRRCVVGGRTRVRQPTWRREHRTLGYMLPGRGLVPRARVLVGLDVSGSMREYADELEALARAAAQQMDVEVWYWADRAGRTPDTVGGGTSFESLLRAWARQRADLAIVITDGYVEWGVRSWPVPDGIARWALLVAGGGQPIEGMPWAAVQRVSV